MRRQVVDDVHSLINIFAVTHREQVLITMSIDDHILENRSVVVTFQ